jgi:hypothetical protein
MLYMLISLGCLLCPFFQFSGLGRVEFGITWFSFSPRFVPVERLVLYNRPLEAVF